MNLRGRRDLLLRKLRLRTRSAAYLRKWVVLGAVIGVISGLGAALFFVALDFASQVFLGLAGYVPASPLGEGAKPITDAARPWMLPIVVGLGGLIAGIIVFRSRRGEGTAPTPRSRHSIRPETHPRPHSARQARGLGHHDRLGRLRRSRRTDGSDRRRVRFVPGATPRPRRARRPDRSQHRHGRGIGAIFRAPLGGAVLAVEIPYRDDVESDALVPAFVGSIVAFSIFGAIIGFSPIFGRAGGAGFTDPSPAHLLHPDRPRLRHRRPPLHRGLLRHDPLVRDLAFAARTETGRGGSRGWLPRSRVAGRSGHRLRLGPGGVRPDPTLLSLPLWVILALPFAKILADLALDWIRRLGRHLRAGHVHRRSGRGPEYGGSSNRSHQEFRPILRRLSSWR